MSARTLPGSRVDAYRAGMRVTTLSGRTESTSDGVDAGRTTNNSTPENGRATMRRDQMHVKRTATIVLGGGAVAAWLAGAATSNRPLSDPVPIARPPVDARGAELAGEIARLRERLTPAAMPRTPARNLFTYRAALAPIAAPAAAPHAAITEVPLAPRALPALKLSGLSEDPAADGAAPVRMAFVSADGQLFIVKEGELVTPRYRVTRIATDGIELLDLTDNTTRQLALR